jgi:hypothetical protein
MSSKEIDDLRTRVSALEQDNETLMGIIMKMSNIFELSGLNNAKEDVPYKKIGPILNRIAKGNPLTAAHLSTMNKYADSTNYNADPFKKMIVSRFENLFYSVNQMDVTFKFDDVMKHLEAMSKKADKVETHAYIRDLKPKQ